MFYYGSLTVIIAQPCYVNPQVPFMQLWNVLHRWWSFFHFRLLWLWLFHTVCCFVSFLWDMKGDLQQNILDPTRCSNSPSALTSDLKQFQVIKTRLYDVVFSGSSLQLTCAAELRDGAEDASKAVLRGAMGHPPDAPKV